MNRVDLIVLSMYRLGGDARSLDIEDIAMEASRISPDTFAWRKYKNQINLELVGFAVRDGKKDKNGKLISGSHADGWRLTVEGQKQGRILERELETSGNSVEVSPVRSKSIEKNRIEKELVRALNSSAFEEWKEKGKSNSQAINHLLKINAYTSDELLEIKKTRLAMCKGIDTEGDEFIDYVLNYNVRVNS